MLTNPLPVGRYQLDLWSPTDAKPVKDGVPVFNKWREKNAERVKVLHAECWNTDPRQTRVLFEVHDRPGAFPFGQLGKPVMVSEVGSAATFVDAVQFLFDPLGSLEATAAQAAARYVSELAAPELAHVRDAINLTRINIATIRALLESIANHTSPDPLSAVATCKQLIATSLEALTAALGSVPGDFARRIVSDIASDLNHLLQAIEDAPARALKAVAQAAKDVVVPMEAGGLGMLVAAAGAFLLWQNQGKRSDTTDTLLLVGAGVALLGYTTLFDNLLHPADHAGKAARILKGEE
jgi:hypothetical protein